MRFRTRATRRVQMALALAAGWALALAVGWAVALGTPRERGARAVPALLALPIVRDPDASNGEEEREHEEGKPPQGVASCPRRPRSAAAREENSSCAEAVLS